MILALHLENIDLIFLINFVLTWSITYIIIIIVNNISIYSQVVKEVSMLKKFASLMGFKSEANSVSQKQNIKQQPNNFQFTSVEYTKFLNCQICKKLMVQAIRLHRCGHTLCASCVQGESVKKCPICYTKIQAKQKDLLATKLVGELQVKCLNQGCPWKGEYHQFTIIHRKQCKLAKGIDQWLNQIQNTISQNSIKFGGQQSNNPQNDYKNQFMSTINEKDEQNDDIDHQKKEEINNFGIEQDQFEKQIIKKKIKKMKNQNDR